MNPGFGPVDLEFQNFLQAEKQKARINGLVHSLNDKCWDLCMNKVQNCLESRTESCLVNCVERFMDATNFIINRFEKTQSLLASQNSMSFE